MTSILYTHSYLKRAAKFLKKHPELADLYAKTLLLAETNINHPSLRLHKLKGRLSELYSISINISYRISIIFIIRKDSIIPVEIGTNNEVY
jgi:proteic killer suppression protein